jgi:ppGpp synthetase/RelA/SpoT-type nucleotidyltranferase
MTIYEKYVNTLRLAMSQIRVITQAVEQAPLAKTEDEIDARIKAIESIIKHCQESKRGLLYFKNKLGKRDIL